MMAYFGLLSDEVLDISKNDLQLIKERFKVELYPFITQMAQCVGRIFFELLDGDVVYTTCVRISPEHVVTVIVREDLPQAKKAYVCFDYAGTEKKEQLDTNEFQEVCEENAQHKLLVCRCSKLYENPIPMITNALMSDDVVHVCVGFPAFFDEYYAACVTQNDLEKRTEHAFFMSKFKGKVFAVGTVKASNSGLLRLDPYIGNGWALPGMSGSPIFQVSQAGIELVGLTLLNNYATGIPEDVVKIRTDLLSEGERLVIKYKSVMISRLLGVEEQAIELRNWIVRVFDFCLMSKQQEMQNMLISVAEILKSCIDQLSEYATDKLIMYIGFSEMLVKTATTKSPAAMEFKRILQDCRYSLAKKMLVLDNGSWLENQNLLSIEPYLILLKKFLTVRCREQNNIESIEEAQLFVRSILIYCNLCDLYDDHPHPMRWDVILSSLKESQKRLVLKYVLMPHESRAQPTALDIYYIFPILKSESTDLNYFLDIFRYLPADMLKDFFSRYRSSYLVAMIKKCRPTADQASNLFTLLNQYRAPADLIQEAVGEIVASLLETNAKDSEEQLIALTTDSRLSQLLIIGLQRYQYIRSRPIDLLSTILVNILTDEQISQLIGFQHPGQSFLFVNVVARLARSKDCADAAIVYVAKLARHLVLNSERIYSIYRMFYNKETCLLKILTDTRLYNLIPDLSAQWFLRDWFKQVPVTTSGIAMKNASEFITAHVPDVDDWDTSNVFCLVLGHIFDFISQNMSKDRKREWVNGLKNFSYSVSRQSAVRILYRTFLDVPNPIPEVIPWEVINSDERVRELLQRDFNQFSERVKNFNFGYTEWTSIINEGLLFEQLADFCNHVVTLEDRQEISRRFEQLFAKIETFASMLDLLVKFLNVSANMERSYIQYFVKHKNDVPLSNIEKSLSSIQDILESLLELNIDLYAVLSSKLFILLFNNLSKGDEISVRTSVVLISQVIAHVKKLVNSNETYLHELELNSIVLLETFFEDVEREKEFLEQLRCNPDRFIDALHVHIRLQLLRDLHEIAGDEEIGFHPSVLSSNEYKQLASITSKEILLKDASSMLQELRDLTCFGEKASKTIYTWSVFSDVKQCKDLYRFCSDLSNRPDETRKRIILQKLDGFESLLFLNYFESISFLTPFMSAREGSVTIRQFFETLCDWDMESVEASRQFKCLQLCNGKNEIERIKQILENTSRDEQALAETVIQMISTGEFKIRLSTKCSFSVTYTDKTSSQCECNETEFREILSNSLFKRDSSKALDEFSLSASLLITIFESFIKLNVIGHMAFQNVDLVLPLNDISNLKNISRQIPVFADDWQQEVAQAYKKFKYLVSFNTKQILLLSLFLDKQIFDPDLQFYQILYSCFDVGAAEIDEERDNAQKRLIQRPEYNWSKFETTRVSISKYVASMLNLVGGFLQRIASRAAVDSFNYTISPASEKWFHDISNLDRTEQLIYLLHLSSRSRDILICKETTTRKELSFKLRIHERLSAGRLVLFGAEKLSRHMRHVLVLYLRSTINTTDKQIICLLLDGATGFSSFEIHSVPVLLADVKSGVMNRLVRENRKFSKCEYYDMFTGSGKTYTIHKRMNQHVPNDDKAKLVVDINNSTSIEEIIRRLSKPLHSQRDGAIYINFSHDIALSNVNQILIEMMILGSISSIETGEVLTVPKICQRSWQVFIEIPAQDERVTSEMTESLYPLPLFASPGRLFEFELTERAVRTVSFIHYLLRANQSRRKFPILSPYRALQILRSIIQQYCKNIPLSVNNSYSHRTLSQFLVFMNRGCKYDSWKQTRQVIKHCLLAADDFFNPILQSNRYQKDQTFSSLIVTQLYPNIIKMGIRDLHIDYKLVELLASAMDAEEKQVSRVLDKHKYVVTPQFLHKLIQINQRSRVNLATVVEGDSGTGKTKLVEVYADIMTSSHCDAVSSLKDFIFSFRIHVKNRGDEEKQKNYLRKVFEGGDCQAIFEAMKEINQCPSRKFKEIAIDRLCDYAIELFNPIFDRAQTIEDRAIRSGAQVLLGRIKSLEYSERIATLQHIIELVVQQGRAFLSRTVISKFEQVIRTDIVENASAVKMNDQRSLKEHLLSILNKDRKDAVISYLEYILRVCRNRAQLMVALVREMKLFISAHPLVNPPNMLEQFLLNPHRDYNQFIDMIRLYLSMDRHSSFISVLMDSAFSSKDMFAKLAHFLELAERSDSLSQHEKCQHCGGCANFVCFIEVNNTKLGGMLRTLLVDHRWLEYSFTKRLPKNISWICSINPYYSESFDVHSEKSAAMNSFKIFWDKLDNQQMKEYIQSKISLSKTLFTLNLTETKVRALSKLIMRSHQHVAKVIQEDKLRSIVSQRDIHRVFQLLEWFYTRNDMKHDPSRPDRLKFSALMAIAFCYYFRLTSERRSEFSNVIMGLTSSIWGTRINLTELVHKVMDYFVEQIEVPPSIVKNHVLKQNMLTLMVCIENRIPITLIGPPGCSKTLSVQLVNRSMGRKGFMKTFQKVDIIHKYQGSRQSTSEEIEKVCGKALASQHYFDEQKVNKLALFFFDEAGIPASEKESLNVLHYYLSTAKFPCVLITNDPLDKAISNRGIEILVSQPDEGDLGKSAESIIKRHENDNLTPETFRILEACCKAYMSLMGDNTNTYTRKLSQDWIGMRDFYHLIRFIRRKSTGLSIDITPQLLLQGLERNFNGLGASSLKKIVKVFFSECQKVDPAFNLQSSNLNCRLNLEVLKDSLLDTNIETDLGNLNETCVRFKLVVDETLDNSLASILFDTGVIDKKKTELLNLSDFAGDKNDTQRMVMVSKTTAAMESGKTILMTNTRSIDGSFYDLYNRYYHVSTTTNGEQEYFTTIAVGAVSEYRRVHKDFQCIVLISASEAKNLEPALLNRFEKYSISANDALLYKRTIMMEKKEMTKHIIDKIVESFKYACNSWLVTDRSAVAFFQRNKLDMDLFFREIIRLCRHETAVYKLLIDTRPIQIPNELCKVVQLEDIHSRDHFIDIATKFCNSDQKIFLLSVGPANPLVHQVQSIIDNELEIIDSKAFIILGAYFSRYPRNLSGWATIFLKGVGFD